MKNLTNLNEELEMVNKKLAKLEALGEDANPMSVEHWENVKNNLVVQIQKAKEEGKTEKVLYFEGAGMDYAPNNLSDVGNYRIRTAFTNLEGKQYYIELGNTIRYNKNGKGKPKVESEWALRIDHLFDLADRGNEGYEMKRDFQIIRLKDYSKADITKWINEVLNCDFDTIEVLDMFHGYRVHSDDGFYNLMDHMEINHERAAKRKAAYDLVDSEYRILLNEKYSKISLKEMDNESITIRCYASDQALKNLQREKRIKIAN